MVEKKLDTAGTVCPMPAFKTKKEAKGLEKGESLRITGDCVEAVENIIRIAKKENCEIIHEEISGDTFKVIIKKK
ncbi:MAG: sulfurtransferase TusA family protein [Promethearchaeota archaeon]